MNRTHVSLPAPLRAVFPAVVLLAVVLLFSGCGGGPQSVAEAPSPEAAPERVKRVVVAPFRDMAAVYGEGVGIRCPISGTFMDTGPVAERAAGLLTDGLFTMMQKNRDLDVVPPAVAAGAMSGVMEENREEGGEFIGERELLVHAARALKADGVLAGYVYRFVDRVGRSYGIESPASVSLRLYLIGARSGRILWTGNFDETQQPLSDNLFKLSSFLDRKGQWVTADEMALSAIEGLLKEYPAP